MRFSVFFLCIHLGALFCQSNMKLTILPQWQGGDFVLDSTYVLSPTHFISIDVCKFYVSDITFLKDSLIVYREKNSFHLLDSEYRGTFDLNFNVSKFSNVDRVRFQLGIDSLTNVSGAMGGDLDPTKGMYWTWQTGYINAKIEGKSSLSSARKNSFVFHIGGFKKPFYTLKTIELPVIVQNNKIELILDLSSFIEAIDMKLHNHIMSPSGEADKIAGLLSENFKAGNK